MSHCRPWDVFSAWLDQLARETAAQRSKQQQVVEKIADPAKAIAKELLRRGVRPTSSVESVISLVKKLSGQDPHSSELRLVMAHLPSQWEDYRVLMQRMARQYFIAHRAEHKQFAAQWFKQTTFQTMWNDVWMNYTSHVSTQHLGMLKRIQAHMSSLPEPNTAQVAAYRQAKALPDKEKPIVFTDDDIQVARDATRLMLANQEQLLKARKKRLDDSINQSATHFEHLRQAIDKCIAALSARSVSMNGLSSEDEDNAQVLLTSGTVAIINQKFLTTNEPDCYYMQTLTQPVASDMLIKVSDKKRDAKVKAFHTHLQDLNFRQACCARVRARNCWLTISEMHAQLHQVTLPNEAELPSLQARVHKAYEVAHSWQVTTEQYFNTHKERLLQLAHQADQATLFYMMSMQIHALSHTGKATTRAEVERVVLSFLPRPKTDMLPNIEQYMPAFKELTKELQAVTNAGLSTVTIADHPHSAELLCKEAAVHVQQFCAKLKEEAKLSNELRIADDATRRLLSQPAAAMAAHTTDARAQQVLNKTVNSVQANELRKSLMPRFSKLAQQAEAQQQTALKSDAWVSAATTEQYHSVLQAHGTTTMWDLVNCMLWTAWMAFQVELMNHLSS